MPVTRQSKTAAKSKAPAAKKAPKKAVPAKNVPAIHASMNVMEVISMHPGAAAVLSAYGLNCHQCAFNAMDTLDAGARTHGLGDDDIDNIVGDLTDLLKNVPGRPETIELTESAGKALWNIAVQEGKKEMILRVASDDRGGFCMEFSETVEPSDKKFSHPAVKNVMLIATSDALMRIGGSTVDFRDGRFKLDLPDAPAACGCAEGSDCGCKK